MIKVGTSAIVRPSSAEIDTPQFSNAMKTAIRPTSQTPLRPDPQSPATRTGLAFSPEFATPGTSAYEEIPWENRTAEITDETDKTMFRQENIEVPAAWSELGMQFYTTIHTCHSYNGGSKC